MNPPRAAAPASRKNRGCLIALGIAVGLLVLSSVGVGLFAWYVLSSEKGRAAVGMIREVASVSSGADRAPGTEELRALGCSSARAIDLTRFRELAQKSQARSAAVPGDERVVLCVVESAAAPAPTCEQVAATYLRAVPPPQGSVLVAVQRAGQQEQECRLSVDSAGRPRTGAEAGDAR